MSNKPHYGIINNGILTWVNAPLSQTEKNIFDMVASDLEIAIKGMERDAKRANERMEQGVMTFLNGGIPFKTK